MQNSILFRKQNSIKLILGTALLVGTLDISAAFLNSYIRADVSPIIVLQFIASGLIGDPSFEGGILTALLGLVLHYFIALAWTFIDFYFISKINFTAKYKYSAGLLYGIFIWLIMNLVVVPLSNTPVLHLDSVQKLIGISFIIFLIGLPISIMYHKYNKESYPG